jgi:hypothetical protein
MIEHVVTARAEENMFGKTKNPLQPPITPWELEVHRATFAADDPAGRGRRRSGGRRRERSAGIENDWDSMLVRSTWTRSISPTATSENVGRNSGLSMQAALAALRALVNSPQPGL